MTNAVFNDILKSSNDKRSYRGCVFGNKLKVVLVSDSETDWSAAAMAVHVGHYSDPKTKLGLAHFCEHMLFLGTKKYPDENRYSKFITEHGGHTNAYTTGDKTCYYYDIAPDHLKESLDIFAQFFISPLFTESATEREVNAIHSENMKNLPNDGWRLDQLDQALCDSNHDFSKFGTGNLETLLPDSTKTAELRQDLINFHEKFYSPNRMGFAIVGKESLDELEKIVVEQFSSVVNKDLPEISWEKHPYSTSQMGIKVFLNPVKDIRNFVMKFPLPDYRSSYKSCPAGFVSHLLGYEGPGSILAELKRRGWSNNIDTGSSSAATGFWFFEISLDMTDEGLAHLDEIIQMIFQYIHLIKQEGVQSWIFKEEKNLMSMFFRFRDKEQPHALVTDVASHLLHYPIPDVLSAGVLLESFTPDQIREVLSFMTPENCRVFIAAQSLKSKCVEKERWYQTEYSVQPFTPRELETYKRTDGDFNLHMPSKNQFIPTDFAIKNGDASQQLTMPVLMQETEQTRLWFKQDNLFQLPKCCVSFQLFSPAANTDPFAAVCSYVFLCLVKDALNELAYNAELAGLCYTLGVTSNGMTLTLSGYNHKQHVLLGKIVEQLQKPQIDQARYVSLLDAYVRGLKNFETEQPYSQAMYYHMQLAQDVFWTHEEKLRVVSDLTLQKVLDFGSNMLSRLFIEVLVYGNASQEDALSVLDILNSRLGSCPVPFSQIRRPRDTMLPPGSHYIYKNYNNFHQSSACAVYFQLEPKSQLTENLTEDVLTSLLVQVIRENFFNKLRTEEQLGYIVDCGRVANHSTGGLVFSVQSDRHPCFLEERIENFISNISEFITNLTPEEFSSHVQALNSIITEKPIRLSIQNKIFYKEITTAIYCFDRKERYSKFLTQSVTQQMLHDFFMDHFSVSSAKRRKVSMHIISEQVHGSGDTETEMYKDYPGVVVQDISAFKFNLPLAPFPTPAMELKSGSHRLAKL